MEISVPAITGICLCLGKIFKVSPINSRVIPYVCAFAGIFLGVLGFYFVPGFPADNLLDAIWAGLSSGGLSVGLHQMGKQFGGDGSDG